MRLLIPLVLAAGCSSVTDVDVKITQVDVETTGSVAGQMQFFTGEESQAFRQQYGDKLGAVDRIDLVLVEIEAPVPLDVIDIGGAHLERVGQRSSLDGDIKQHVLKSVEQGLPVMVPVTISGAMRCTLQPILVVQALEAL